MENSRKEIDLVSEDLEEDTEKHSLKQDIKKEKEKRFKVPVKKGRKKQGRISSTGLIRMFP